MLPTSGTVGQTQVSVAQLVDSAWRRAGKNPSTVSGELLEAALLSLYMVTTAFVNKGVNLWCIRKNVLNVILESAQYPLAAGSDDVLNCLYRVLTDLPGTPIAGVDFRGVQLTTPTAVQNVSGVFDTAGVTGMVVEYNQGLGWKQLIAFGGATVEVGSDFAADFVRPVVAAGWRIRDASGNNLVPSAVKFRTIYNELNMAQLNRDDYVNLPNKFFKGQKALQYWYDKQINPALYVWPMSDRAQDQLVVYQHSQIEDIGNMSNALAVPARWYEATVLALAARLCLEIPPSELPPGRLETVTALANEAVIEAGRGESDGSSYRLQPRIGCYTA